MGALVRKVGEGWESGGEGWKVGEGWESGGEGWESGGEGWKVRMRSGTVGWKWE